MISEEIKTNKMSFDNLDIKIKDVIQSAIYIIMFMIFVISMNNKIDLAIVTINEIKTGAKETQSDYKNINEQMKNQIQLNKNQIELLKQDIEMIKLGYYPSNR